MTPEEIENQRIAKLRSTITTREHLNTISAEISALEKQLIELKEAWRQARHLLSLARTEAEILESEFWQAKKI